MRAAAVGLLVAAAFVLSGCQYLLGGMMGGPILIPNGSFDPGEFGSFDPSDVGSFDPDEFSFPPPTATFTKGSATLTIDGTASTLDKLSGNAAIYEGMGSEVGWTDGDGLYARFYGEPGSVFGDGFVTIDRVVGGQHWTVADPSACKVTLEKNDATGVSGTATCKDLRWVDALTAGGSPTDPGFIKGEEPFDAEITFEATP